MIEESAIVIASEAGIAEVEVVRRPACSACSSSAACGVSLLDRLLGRRPQHLVVGNKIGAVVGETVIVGIPEGALLKAAVAAYLMPLLGLLAGALLGQTLAEHSGLAVSTDVAGLVGGCIGFGMSLWGLRIYSRRLARDARYRATLRRRADRASPLEVALPKPR
jgi:sigma-E factor negative regulatory protein RseC